MFKAGDKVEALVFLGKTDTFGITNSSWERLCKNRVGIYVRKKETAIYEHAVRFPERIWYLPEHMIRKLEE